MAYLILQHLPEPAAGIIQAAVIIGRKAGHAIVVDDPSVSRRHAKIVKDGRAYFISDMDSRTGTRINGRPIDREKLHGGDEITIGPAKIIFKRGLHLPAGVKPIRLHAHGRFRKETSE